MSFIEKSEKLTGNHGRFSMNTVSRLAGTGRRTVILAVAGALALITATAAVAAVNGFKDVPEEHMFANEIQWLSDNDITRGCNAAQDMFCPEDFVTRGQMAAFLYRFANQVDLKGAAGEPGKDGKDGKDGRDGVSGYEVVSVEFGSVDQFDQADVQASCPEGKVALGGGVEYTHVPFGYVDGPMVENGVASGWKASLVNGIPDPLSGTLHVTCAEVTPSE